MSLESLDIFVPNEHTEECYNGGPNYKIFLFKIEDKKYNYVGEKIVSFEKKNDEIVV